MLLKSVRCVQARRMGQESYDNDADDDGVCDWDEVVGCQDINACNYNEAATDADICTYATDVCSVCSGETDGSGVVIDNDMDDDGVCDWDEVLGCQDGSACNFNVAATDEGSCVFPDGICDSCSGEIDGTGTVVDNDADDDWVCDEDEVVGCQDGSACNFNFFATDEDLCVFPDGICESCSGAIDGTGTVIDNDSDNDGVCDFDEVLGCQNTLACNYNAEATDSGACVFAEENCQTCSGEIDGTGTIIDNDSDSDGVCDWDEVVGCQDSLACNFNPAATDADDCTYPDCEGGCSPMDSPLANGGCVTYDGDYAIHTFTSNSDFTIYQTLDSVSILVVGGGGGGQNNSQVIGGPTITGAGAGAGGVVWIPETENFQLLPQSYSIEIGQGGTYVFNNSSIGTGGESSINGSDLSLVAKGGGSWGGPGGSGGGQRGGSQCSSSYNGAGIQPDQPGASGLYGYGHNGSPASNCQSAFPYQILAVGGAGGGAGGPASGGAGGVGMTIDVSGDDYVYATGGSNNGSGPGPSNFGDGGRGGSANTSGVAGVVIIRYKYQ